MVENILHSSDVAACMAVVWDSVWLEREALVSYRPLVRISFLRYAEKELYMLYVPRLE